MALRGVRAAAQARGMADERMPALMIDSEDNRSDGRRLRLVSDADASAPAALLHSGRAPKGPAHPSVRVPSIAPAHPSVVVPGIGVAHPGHVGAATSSLLQPILRRTLQSRGVDPKLAAVARQAQADPTRYGADLLSHAHAPHRYAELARARRLPSQVWAEHEGRGRLAEHLRDIHGQLGEALVRDHGHRPLGERVLIGLAAGAGAHQDVARAIEAFRVRPGFPVRASFTRLMHGIPQPEIARIASVVMVPGHQPEHVIHEFRGIRERLTRSTPLAAHFQRTILSSARRLPMWPQPRASRTTPSRANVEARIEAAYTGGQRDTRVAEQGASAGDPAAASVRSAVTRARCGGARHPADGDAVARNPVKAGSPATPRRGGSGDAVARSIRADDRRRGEHSPARSAGFITSCGSTAAPRAVARDPISARGGAPAPSSPSLMALASGMASRRPPAPECPRGRAC